MDKIMTINDFIAKHEVAIEEARIKITALLMKENIDTGIAVAAFSIIIIAISKEMNTALKINPLAIYQDIESVRQGLIDLVPHVNYQEVH